jgi:hypothetical protein
MINRSDAASEKTEQTNEVEKMMLTALRDMCSVRRAAEILKVKPRQIRFLIDEHKIDAVKLDDWLWIVHIPSLNKYAKTKSRRGRPSSVVRTNAPS